MSRSVAAGRAELRAVLFTVGLLFAIIVSIWCARRVIDAVYAGILLPDLLENRGDKPLEYYHSVIDRLVYAGYGLVALLGAVWYVARYRSAPLVLGILLLGDVIFCVLSETYGGRLDVRLDGGIPEFFQYAKEMSAAFLLLRLFTSTGRRIFLGWGLLFSFLLLDDALKYHERAGRLIAMIPGMEELARMVSVRTVDIGEMLSLIPVLFALIAFLALPYAREGSEGRATVHRLGALLGALIAVGGAMDILDRVAVTRGSQLVPLLSLIEDGGEMVIMSVTLAYVMSLGWDAESRRRATGAAPDGAPVRL